MITIPRATLLPALAATQKVVEKRNTIPILGNLLFAAEAGRLTIVATDLDIEASVTVGCAGDMAAVTLPAHTLHDAVRKLPDGCDVQIAHDGANATVSAGRSRFRLPVLPAGDFPRMAAGGYGHAFALPAASLKRMLDTIRFAVSTEETRYYLNGIYWHHDADAAGGPRLTAVATDGHRLAMIALPAPEGAADMPGIIVPRRTCDLLKDVAARKGNVSIELSEVRIRFAAPEGDGGPELAIVSKLIDGTFPDYRRVVPASHANRFEVDGAALRSAVDRVATITPSTGGRSVRFAFSAQALVLQAVNPDAGEATDEVTIASAEGDPVEIGFNGRYCLELLAAAPEGTIRFHLADAGAPARIEPAAAPDTVFVLMPMRI